MEKKNDLETIDRREKFGDYLVDISKYVLTAILVLNIARRVGRKPSNEDRTSFKNDPKIS